MERHNQLNEMLGELEMDKWPFEDAQVGIYSTDQFSKRLNVLDDEGYKSSQRMGH